MYEAIKIDDELSLSQLSPDDAAEMFALVDNNRSRLAEWLPWPDQTQSVEDSRDFLKSVIERRSEGTVYGYGVLADGKVIGHASLMHVSGNDPKAPEIGYWIDKNYANRGITTKVTEALTKLGFNDLKLDKIVIRADINNGPSNRVAEKAGYSMSGQKYDEETKRQYNLWVLSRENVA